MLEEDLKQEDGCSFGWECKKCGYETSEIIGAIPRCPRCGEEMSPAVQLEDPPEGFQHPFKKGGPYRTT